MFRTGVIFPAATFLAVVFTTAFFATLRVAVFFGLATFQDVFLTAFFATTFPMGAFLTAVFFAVAFLGAIFFDAVFFEEDFFNAFRARDLRVATAMAAPFPNDVLCSVKLSPSCAICLAEIHHRMKTLTGRQST
jgi:hypothetical protein